MRHKNLGRRLFDRSPCLSRLYPLKPHTGCGSWSFDHRRQLSAWLTLLLFFFFTVFSGLAAVRGDGTRNPETSLASIKSGKSTRSRRGDMLGKFAESAEPPLPPGLPPPQLSKRVQGVPIFPVQQCFAAVAGGWILSRLDGNSSPCFLSLLLSRSWRLETRLCRAQFLLPSAHLSGTKAV